MLISDNQKEFEKPKSGAYIGTVVDVVDLGKVATKFGEKVKVRIVWLLNSNDSTGKPYQVMSQVNANMNQRAALYTIIKDILGTPPPAGSFETENLIGKSNQLFIVTEKAEDGKIYANVRGILPLPEGTPVFVVPVGFTRDKDRVKTPQTQRSAPATTTAVTTTTVAPASTPYTGAPEQVAADAEVAF